MEETPHLDIDELYETKQKVDINRVNMYNKLIFRIHHKIKVASKQRINNQFCYFVMPEILIGFPNYDFNECLLYVISSLENDGFLVKYIHPNLILVSWNHWIPEYVRNEIKSRTGKTIDKFGNVKEDKTRQIRDEPKNERKVSFQEDKKKKNVNEKYVPSGKFIYNNDLLDTIRNII
jgi:hypothetical protein